MATLDVTVRHWDGTTEQQSLPVSRIVNCGMAGRKQPTGSERDRQLSQLEQARGELPDELPVAGPKPAHLLTTDSTIQVNSTQTAGESEFVLFPTEERTYVGVGVDHKNYTLAEENIRVANSTCPSIVGDEVWVLEELREQWDDIELRSWVGEGDGLSEYQFAPLSEYMEPDALLDAIDDRMDRPLEGTAVWSGTVGTDRDGVDPFPDVVRSDFYMAHLYDPELARRLVVHYEVQPNTWMRGASLP